LGTTLSLAVPIPPASTMVTTTTYTGGNTASGTTWTNGLPTSTGNAGLINASGWWAGRADFHVLMTGGNINPTGNPWGPGGPTDSFAMQGGANGTSSILEIDDTNSSLTFSDTGRFSMWNNPAITGSTGNELNMLNGEVSFGEFWANGGTDARVNILNGVFNADALAANLANAVVTMMAGGTGAFNLGDMISTNTMDEMVLNFEAGSAASFTIASNGVATAQGYWETKIAAGRVTIDGAVATAGQFKIEDVGATGTKISLDLDQPTPTELYVSWIGGYGVSDPAMDADPDGDAYDNLFEYGVGGNPNDAGVNGNIPETSTVGDWFYYVHYERTDKDDVGLSYALEAGSDLVNTNWSAGNLDPVGSGAGPFGYMVYTNRVSTETLGAQFIKLDVGFAE
jgi:hypothetical protein